MLKRLVLKFSSWIAVLPVLLIPASVHAAFSPGLTSAATNAGSVGTSAGLTGNAVGTTGNELPTMIGKFISILLGALGVILVLIIIYAGILYMTANGEDDKVKKAKKMIQQAIIGIVLIIAAYAISSFVITQISNASIAA